MMPSTLRFSGEYALVPTPNKVAQHLSQQLGQPVHVGVNCYKGHYFFLCPKRGLDNATELTAPKRLDRTLTNALQGMERVIEDNVVNSVRVKPLQKGVNGFELVKGLIDKVLETTRHTPFYRTVPREDLLYSVAIGKGKNAYTLITNKNATASISLDTLMEKAYNAFVKQFQDQ